MKLPLPLPWASPISKKFHLKLVILRLSDLPKDSPVLALEVSWKGPKAPLKSLRRTTRRNVTRKVAPVGKAAGGVEVEWNEEFGFRLTLTAREEGVFQPWEVAFSVRNGQNNGQKNDPLIGTALLNLSEFAGGNETVIQIPVTLEDTTASAGKQPPFLHLALSFMELTAQESGNMTQKKIVPALSPPNPRSHASIEKDDVSALRTRLKVLKSLVSVGRSKKTRHEDEGSDGKVSSRSDNADYTYPFDTDSMDDPENEESEDGKSNVRKSFSFSYGTLATANHIGDSFYSDIKKSAEFDDCIYYSYRQKDVGITNPEDMTASPSDLSQNAKRSILPWKRKRLSFKSPKPKGEPLLKPYGEDGGDDIDFDRRQLSSSDESLGMHKTDDDLVANRYSLSDFGDDSFVIGSWEAKEVVSRDGHMKLSSQVFFASIDQRSERAAGESACAVLVAVIADWFQNNQALMPIRSQFDSLIREGSSEWRRLCENETYLERFPDKHFDLETVIQAKIRPLSVTQSKSFVGFFHPEGVTDDNDSFEFLHEAMSFDGIWEHISKVASNCPADGTPQLYIVSWNDHFFILKVEPDAYYIIDTLGERLYEGCDQAYILKFDKNTLIHTMPPEEKPTAAESSKPQKNKDSSSGELSDSSEKSKKNVDSGGEKEDCKDNDENDKKGGELVCQGKESCKEYIKNFLAAIPIRELQADMKKGLLCSSAPIHHRLQVEFNYTQLSEETEVVTELASENAGGIVAQQTIEMVPAVEETAAA